MITNMKTKIFSIAALGLAMLSLASCGENFLEVSSKTEGTTGNFYSSEAAASRALIGCYDGWQRTVSNGPTFAFHYLAELLSDECFGGTGNNDARNSAVVDRFDMGEDNSQQDLHNTLWTSYYAAIYRCNELLQRVEGLSWSSEEAQGTLIGEARAMRGILYFDLVRIFENIPLLTVPSTENIAQAPVDDVYAVIFDDLKYAAQNIPANAYPKEASASNDGRITCYAAKAFLARAYLFYTGVYGKEPAGVTKSEVLQGLEDIIASGEYELIPLYKNLWFVAAHSRRLTARVGVALPFHPISLIRSPRLISVAKPPSSTSQLRVSRLLRPIRRPFSTSASIQATSIRSTPLARASIRTRTVRGL